MMRQAGRLTWLIGTLAYVACVACGGQVRHAAMPDPDHGGHAGVPLAARPLSWRSLVGCYHTAETHFALDSIPATYVTLLSPPEGARQGWSYWYDGSNAYWRVLPGDTIEFVAGSSLHGGRYRWVARGDTLVGHFLGWSDIPFSRSRRVRTDARREPCSTEGPGDSPLLHAAILSDSLPAAVAATIADSILPRLGNTVPIFVHSATNAFGYSARVAKILMADPRVSPASDAAYATRVHAEDFRLHRDRLAVTVVTRTCDDRPGHAYRVDSTRFRFVAAGTGWRLVRTERLPSIHGMCGAEMTDVRP